MWQVRDRLIVYDADAPGDGVTDNLQAHHRVCGLQPLTYSRRATRHVTLHVRRH